MGGKQSNTNQNNNQNVNGNRIRNHENKNKNLATINNNNNKKNNITNDNSINNNNNNKKNNINNDYSTNNKEIKLDVVIETLIRIYRFEIKIKELCNKEDNKINDPGCVIASRNLIEKYKEYFQLKSLINQFNNPITLKYINDLMNIEDITNENKNEINKKEECISNIIFELNKGNKPLMDKIENNIGLLSKLNNEAKLNYKSINFKKKKVIIDFSIINYDIFLLLIKQNILADNFLFADYFISYDNILILIKEPGDCSNNVICEVGKINIKDQSINIEYLLDKDKIQGSTDLKDLLKDIELSEIFQKISKTKNENDVIEFIEYDFDFPSDNRRKISIISSQSLISDEKPNEITTFKNKNNIAFGDIKNDEMNINKIGNDNDNDNNIINEEESNDLDKNNQNQKNLELIDSSIRDNKENENSMGTENESDTIVFKNSKIKLPQSNNNASQNLNNDNNFIEIPNNQNLISENINIINEIDIQNDNNQMRLRQNKNKKNININQNNDQDKVINNNVPESKSLPKPETGNDKANKIALDHSDEIEIKDLDNTDQDNEFEKKSTTQINVNNNTDIENPEGLNGKGDIVESQSEEGIKESNKVNNTQETGNAQNKNDVENAKPKENAEDGNKELDNVLEESNNAEKSEPQLNEINLGEINKNTSNDNNVINKESESLTKTEVGNDKTKESALEESNVIKIKELDDKDNVNDTETNNLQNSTTQINVNNNTDIENPEGLNGKGDIVESQNEEGHKEPNKVNNTQETGNALNKNDEKNENAKKNVEDDNKESDNALEESNNAEISEPQQNDHQSEENNLGEINESAPNDNNVDKNNQNSTQENNNPPEKKIEENTKPKEIPTNEIAQNSQNMEENSKKGNNDILNNNVGLLNENNEKDGLKNNNDNAKSLLENNKQKHENANEQILNNVNAESNGNKELENNNNNSPNNEISQKKQENNQNNNNDNIINPDEKGKEEEEPEKVKKEAEDKKNPEEKEKEEEENEKIKGKEEEESEKAKKELEDKKKLEEKEKEEEKNEKIKGKEEENKTLISKNEKDTEKKENVEEYFKDKEDSVDKNEESTDHPDEVDENDVISPSINSIAKEESKDKPDSADNNEESADLPDDVGGSADISPIISVVKKEDFIEDLADKNEETELPDEVGDNAEVSPSIDSIKKEELIDQKDSADTNEENIDSPDEVDDADKISPNINSIEKEKSIEDTADSNEENENQDEVGEADVASPSINSIEKEVPKDKTDSVDTNDQSLEGPDKICENAGVCPPISEDIRNDNVSKQVQHQPTHFVLKKFSLPHRKLNVKTKQLLLFSIYQKKMIESESRKDLKENENVLLINKEFFEKYFYNEIMDLINEDNELKDEIKNIDINNFSISSIKNIIFKLDNDKINGIDDKISNVNADEAYAFVFPKEEEIQIINKELKIYNDFIAIDRQIFANLIQVFNINLEDQNVSYVSFKKDFILKVKTNDPNLLIIGHFNKNNSSNEISYILDFNKEEDINNHFHSVYSYGVDYYVSDKLMFEKGIEDDYISPIFNFENIIGYGYKYDPTISYYTKLDKYIRLLNCEILKNIITLFSYDMLFEAKKKCKLLENGKYYLVRPEYLNYLKEEFNYFLLSHTICPYEPENVKY